MLGTGWLLAGAAAQAQGSAPAPARCPPGAQAPTPQAVREAQEAARDRGFLWRLRKDGRTSYLYGTIHLGTLAWAPPGPTVRAALDDTQVLALELDITDAATMERMQAVMAQHAGSGAIDARQRERLVRASRQACLPDGALDRLHPAMQALTLVMLEARWEGLDGSYAQEAVLAGYAQSRGMRISSLESVDEQIGALLPATSAETGRFVDQALQQLASGAARRSARRLAQAWADGAFETLADYERWCECVAGEEDRQLLRRLNDDRNPALALRIERLHTQTTGGVFAAVGALHHTGPKALPQLLQQRGFDVERVSFPK